MADRRYSVPVGDKLVSYGTWDHDPSKYRNFKVIFETVRSQFIPLRVHNDFGDSMP